MQPAATTLAKRSQSGLHPFSRFLRLPQCMLCKVALQLQPLRHGLLKRRKPQCKEQAQGDAALAAAATSASRSESGLLFFSLVHAVQGCALSYTSGDRAC